MSAAIDFGLWGVSTGECPRGRISVEYGDERVPPSTWAWIYPEPNTGCWLWGGSVDKDGYGKAFTRTLPQSSAYRQLWILLFGPVPEGCEIDHLCRVRACVNPAHLQVVTAFENKSRAARYRPPVLKTHCRHGHEYTPETTRRRMELGRPRRVCLTCVQTRDDRRAPTK